MALWLGWMVSLVPMATLPALPVAALRATIEWREGPHPIAPRSSDYPFRQPRHENFSPPSVLVCPPMSTTFVISAAARSRRPARGRGLSPMCVPVAARGAVVPRRRADRIVRGVCWQRRGSSPGRIAVTCRPPWRPAGQGAPVAVRVVRGSIQVASPPQIFCDEDRKMQHAERLHARNKRRPAPNGGSVTSAFGRADQWRTV